MLADKGHSEVAARAGQPARRAVPSDLVGAKQAVVHAVHLAQRVRQQVAEPVRGKVEHLDVPVAQHLVRGRVRVKGER